MLKIDLHIHSIHSGHAYGSFYEITAEARKKQMSMIALADHGPHMEGTSGSIHFYMRDRAPKSIDGVRILWGCEANIISAEGELDLVEELQERLDLVLVGLHQFSGYKDLGRNGNTAATIKALKNKCVRILTHPTHPQYDYDIKRVIEACLEQNVLPELNLSYLRADAESVERFRLLLDMVRTNHKRVIINSDAHFLHEIGDDSKLEKLGPLIGLTPEIIINNYPKDLTAFLGLPALPALAE
jgi:putative hydrolase